MHLISHFCSGFCAGSLMPRPSEEDSQALSILTVPTLTATGAVLPDLDGISVFFNHQIYYGPYAYSHHGSLHSPLGIFPLCLLLSYLFSRCREGWSQRGLSRSYVSYFIPLYLGSLLHLLEDLPCPPEPWGGLMILWPFSVQRFGGWAHIWFLNEFLMVFTFGASCLSLCLLVIIAKRRLVAWSRFSRLVLVGVNLSSLLIVLVFVLVSRYESEEQWEQVQRALLGDGLHSLAGMLNRLVEAIWSREIL